MLVSRKRRGACTALRWDDADRRYRCGLLATPQPARGEGVAGAVTPSGAVRVWQRLRLRWLRRWIAAGIGCDCDMRAEPD